MNKPTGESTKVKREIAVRMAAGQGPDETAKAVKRHPRTVARIRADINQGRDPELVAVYEKAKQELSGKLLAALSEHATTLQEELRKDAPIHHKAQGYGALTKAFEAVHERPNEAGMGGGAGVQINVKDPQVMAAMIQALRGLNEAKEIDVTPRGGGDGGHGD